MNIDIKKANNSEDLQQCLAIRKKVFVEGQKVPIEEEVDGKDQDSDHYLLLLDKRPVGVARLRYLSDIAKIERVATLDDYQGMGLGKILMEAILSDLVQNSKISKAKLSSQSYAIPFYEKLGFKVCSEEYLDAGILHKDMLLNLSD